VSVGILIGLLALAGGGFVLLAGLDQQRQAELADPGEYLRSLDNGVSEHDEFQQLLAEPFLRRVLHPLGAQFLSTVAAALPGNYRDSVNRKLVHAGLAGRYRAEEIITGQILAGGVGFILAVFGSTFVSSQLRIAMLVLWPVIASLIPVVLLNRAVTERRAAILQDLPDTLDLLAISVEAGVGFEAALEIVCEHFDSALASEFSRTLKEMELGLPRREALQNLKRRTEVPELSNFVLALTQADALGMPVGRVLKIQAAEMRMKRRQWARERAAKLPVKILFPLMLFIFPPVFIIVLGPAAAEIGKSLH
jgi:tight adherence protein C